MLAAPAPGFFVAGKIHQSAAATEPASADAAIELSAAVPRLVDANVTAARADLDAASDALVADASAGCQRDGQAEEESEEALRISE